MENLITLIETFLAHSDDKLEELSQKNKALKQELKTQKEE